MADITISIPNDKIQRVIDAMKGLYPIPKIPDPEWVDPKDGSVAPLINKFTDQVWAKKCVVNYIKQSVARYEQAQAIRAVAYTIDEEIAS